MDGMNKEKWQAMSRQQKFEHVKYYYGKYIIIGLVALIVVGQLLYTSLTHVEPVLSVLVMNNLAQQNTQQSVFDEFCSEFGYDNSEGKMEIIDNFYILTEEEGATNDITSESYQNLQALQTWLYAGQDDVIIGRGSIMEYSLIDGEAFTDLRDVFSAAELEKYAPYIVYGEPVDLDEEYEDVMEERSEPYPCAIRLDDNGWILEIGYYKLGCYAGIPVKAGNKEAAADFLRYLLSKQP